MAERAPVVVGANGSPFGDEALRWAVEDGRLRGGGGRRPLGVGLSAPTARARRTGLRSGLPAGRGDGGVGGTRPSSARSRWRSRAATCGVRPRHPGASRRSPPRQSARRRRSGPRPTPRPAARIRQPTLCAPLSVPLAVVRNTPIPVGDVVVGVDGTDTWPRPLAWAADEARGRRCRLQVLTSTGGPFRRARGRGTGRVPPSAALEGRQLLDHMIAEAPDVADLDLQTAVVSYDPRLSSKRRAPPSCSSWATRAPAPSAVP